MNHIEAIKEWGSRKLEATYKKATIDRSTVFVEIEVEDGYGNDGCCYGCSDGECYSYGESANAQVTIVGRDVEKLEPLTPEREENKAPLKKLYSTQINSYSFGFTDFLGEILESAGGTLTSKTDV